MITHLPRTTRRSATLLLALLCSSGLIGLAGCSSETAPQPSVARVEVVKPSQNFGGFTVGARFQFQALAFDAAGRQLAVPITWTSSDSTIVAIDQTGQTTALRTGNVFLTAAATATDGNGIIRGSLYVDVVQVL
jgi:hypothetical protein